MKKKKKKRCLDVVSNEHNVSSIQIKSTMTEEDTPRLDDEEFHGDSMNDEFQQVDELFSRYKDAPELDSVHLKRLPEVLQAFGKNPSLADCQQRIEELEAAEKFELSLEDFLQILEEPWTSANNDRNTLRRAFEKFDQAHEGFIDIESFRTAMSTLGEPLSDDEIDELIQLGLNDEHKKLDIEYLLDQLLGNN